MKNIAIKRTTKLITSLNSKHYRPLGMLSHRQNLYLTHSQWYTVRCEAQSHEPVNSHKDLPVQMQKDKST
jgi:hypothetical protein